MSSVFSINLKKWTEEIYYDFDYEGFQSIKVMDSDIAFDEFLYFQHHKIEIILSLQGYGVKISTPEGKKYRLFLNELNFDLAINKAINWIENNYVFLTRPQGLLFPSHQDWVNQFLALEKLLDRELKTSKSKYKVEHYTIARLICCYFGGSQLNFFSVFLEEIFNINLRTINSVFKKLHNLGIIEYKITKDNIAQSKIYQINSFIVLNV